MAPTRTDLRRELIRDAHRRGSGSDLTSFLKREGRTRTDLALRKLASTTPPEAEPDSTHGLSLKLLEAVLATYPDLDPEGHPLSTRTSDLLARVGSPPSGSGCRG